MKPPSPSPPSFAEAYNAAAGHVERRYGIPVVIADVPHPFTGDLDGAEIKVDHALDLEEALFVLVHLFGHTVQWNLSPRAREIGGKIPSSPAEALIAEVAEYEREACRYSLQLLHDAGIRGLDGWLSDFAACDLEYLLHLYRTGDKRPFRSFWRDGQPLIEPLAIPDFHPTRWVSRWEGVVL